MGDGKLDLINPSRQDLLEAAALNFLDLTDEDLEGFQSLMPRIFDQLRDLDQMPDDHPMSQGVMRDPGYRPQPDDDHRGVRPHARPPALDRRPDAR